VILVLDNFDSFTFNLVDYLHQCGASCVVVRNNVGLEEIEKLDFEAIVLSPGPGKPAGAGIMSSLIERFHQSKPILGICLGHQALGEFFGASLEKSIKPMHGKVSQIELGNDFMFEGIENPSLVVRYHSLILKKVASPLEIIAKTVEQEVMAIRHPSLPIRGLQFHPEAILTTDGIKMISNWITYYNLKN
jgi:anthranilate synthase component 2